MVPIKPNNEKRIVDSWIRNAVPWIDAVASGSIQSRVRVTDQAIIDAVTARAPRTVLDIGCGEGWLAHALASRGIDVLGVDAVPALVENAKRAGAGRYAVMSYQELANDGLRETFDAAVCNFSLLGEESVDKLVAAARRLLRGNGLFIVQTLHPKYCNDPGEPPAYQDGWREGSWKGCGDGFSRPAPWYFRTLETWLALFESNGLRVAEIREPRDPASKNIASIIFVAVSD